MNIQDPLYFNEIQNLKGWYCYALIDKDESFDEDNIVKCIVTGVVAEVDARDPFSNISVSIKVFPINRDHPKLSNDDYNEMEHEGYPPQFLAWFHKE